LSISVRLNILTTALRWLAVLLILRVLVAILLNYPDYFPPNFDSLFLQGRERTFAGAYRPAFYIHIFSGPIVLLNGLILLSETVRRHYPRLHRYLGRIQVGVLLLFMLPSALVMSPQSFAGWPAGLSFLLLSAATAICAIAGVHFARRQRYHQHRRWMLRCNVLICSAVALRQISGGFGLFGVQNAEGAYIVAAWTSWLVPLVVCEIVLRWGPNRGRTGWPVSWTLPRTTITHANINNVPCHPNNQISKPLSG
jgi:uncharacterized membrane protein